MSCVGTCSLARVVILKNKYTYSYNRDRLITLKTDHIEHINVKFEFFTDK